MVDTSKSIIQRLHDIQELINSPIVNDNDTRCLIAHDGLLDALTVLYDECNNENLKKYCQISGFVSKYDFTIDKLRKLRVNLNDFEQKKVIGKGQFGVVQVVREKQSGNVYAMKTIRKSETSAKKHVSFYEEERDIMAKSESQWITKLQFAFQDESHLYLVMEFHPGGDLLSLLDRFDYSLSEDMISFYLAEIAVAINTLHNMGYVHRDIKPENILIDRCGHIKLVDFGSAAKISSDGSITDKLPIGTPDYLAPEVLSSVNENSSYGVGCDFWSLGVIAYEMIFGETPFHSSEKTSVTYANIMNYKKSLKFKDTVPLSDELRNLLENLLTDAKNRFTFNDMKKHAFFLHANWNNLDSARPPFIPVINSLDDTSNFDEFEMEKTTIDTEAFRSKQTFSGRQLPFIGFTYSRPIKGESMVLNNTIQTLDESLCEPSVLMEKLTAKKKELHEVYLKMNESTSDTQSKQNELKIVKLETKLGLVEKDRKRLENDLEKIRQDLIYEKEDRAETEKKALEIMKNFKDKIKNDEEAKVSVLKEKIELYQKTVQAIDEARMEALTKLRDTNLELNDSKATSLKLRKTVKQKDELIEQLKQKECDGNCSKSSDLSAMLNKASLDLTIETDQKNALQSEISLLSKTITEQENMIEDLRKSKEEAEVKANAIATDLDCKLEELNASRSQMNELAKKTVNELKQKLSECECSLRKEKEERNLIETKLTNLSSKLESVVNNKEELEKTFSNKESELQKQLNDLTLQLKTNIKEKSDLEAKSSQLAISENQQRAKVVELEIILASQKDTLHQLESKHNYEGTDSLKAQIDLLQKQLERSQESGELSRQKVSIAEVTARKAEKELSELKLDMKCVERDLKGSKETAKYLRDSIKEMRTESKNKDGEIEAGRIRENELKEKIEKITQDCDDKLKHKDEDICKLEKEIVTLNSNIESLKNVEKNLEATKKNLNEMKSSSDQAKLLKRSLESEIKHLEAEINKFKDKLSKSDVEKESLQNKLKEKNTEFEQLKTVCTMQDEQLSILDKLYKEKQDCEEEKALLKDEIKNLNELVKASKASANEETSLKLYQERRVKDIESKINEVKEEKENIVKELLKNKEDWINESSILKSKISTLEREMEAVNANLRCKEEQIFELESEIEMFKDENLGHIDHIHNLKESNFKLTDGLEEAVTKGELYKKKIVELEKQFHQFSDMAADKELKMESTINQQTKLIDFLQAKTETPRKKGISRIFGSHNKENSTTPLPRQQRDLENRLAAEKSRSENLSLQLTKAQSEIIALKTKAGIKDADNISNIAKAENSFKTPLKTPFRTPSKSSVKSDLSETPRRHKHKPHRWQSYLAMRAGRCVGCMGNILFSRSVMKCQECNSLAHTKCSGAVAHNCGFKEELHQSSHSDSKQDMENVKKNGWIKVPRHGSSWGKRYAMLINDELKLFRQEPTDQTDVLKSYKFSNADCSLDYSVSKSELSFASVSELPFILKVNFKEGNKTSNVFILTESFEEKRSWANIISSHIKRSPLNSMEEDSPGLIISETLATLTPPSSIDCTSMVHLNNNTALIGATEGLFSFEVSPSKLKFRAKIDGVGSVHQIIVVEHGGEAVFIAGKENLLFSIDLQSLTCAAEALPISKPSISPTVIHPLSGCHLIEASKEGQKVFLCAAASDRISILVWNNSRERWEVCKEYSTQEASSCILFTPSTLIVGAERFYQIDLTNFSIEEFLDESDKTLAHAFYGSAQMSSYPVAVIQVSVSNKADEYLLAFYEFGIFVNSSGKRTREMDLKFSHLPLGIIYNAPYLFIIYENAVEVIELKENSFKKTSELESYTRSTVSKFTKPRYLGKTLCKKGIVITGICGGQCALQSLFVQFSQDDAISRDTISTGSVHENSLDMSLSSICSGTTASVKSTSTINHKRSLQEDDSKGSRRVRRHL